MQVQRDKGRGTMWAPHSGTPPCPGRITPLPARPPAHPRSAEGTPGDPAGAEDPHSHLTGGGAGGSCPPERGKGGGGGRVPGCAPAAGRAGKGPGSLCGHLPLTAAAGETVGAESCPALVTPSGRLSPASSGDSSAWVPGVPAAGRDKGCLLLWCPMLCVCRCSPAAGHPLSPALPMSLRRACRSLGPVVASRSAEG